MGVPPPPPTGLSSTCLWLQNEHEWQFCEEFALSQGGRTTLMPMMPMLVNRISSQCKIKLSQKYCPWTSLQLWNFVTPSFNEWVVFSWLLCFALQYMFIQIGPQTRVLSFVPPGWGANSSQSCRSCSFSGHKQKVLDRSISELQCKVAYKQNTFFLNWKQRTAGKVIEDALQYIKMYVAGV